MKKRLFMVLLAFSLLICMFATACQAVPIISITPMSAIMQVGQEKKLELKGDLLPKDAEVEWMSNNTAVAVVSNDGNVTAIGEGECRIYAIVKGAYEYCIITVEPAILPQ